ncbi:hypothetical protein YC2023_098502 [Brassica napus]
MIFLLFFPGSILLLRFIWRKVLKRENEQDVTLKETDTMLTQQMQQNLLMEEGTHIPVTKNLVPTVEKELNMCSCKRFDIDKIPCVHAAAAAKFLSMRFEHLKFLPRYMKERKDPLKSKGFHQPENLVDEEEDKEGEEAGAGEGEADVCMSILNVEVLLPPQSNMGPLCFELVGNAELLRTAMNYCM